MFETAWDYIVVGSGAGGGTVAARLADSGARVLVLESGADPKGIADPGAAAHYDVPGFHALASEDPAMSWNFFVQHYADPVAAARDPKLTGAGILYPRAGTLGGCTAHNAMILIRPHDADWNGMAALTGDASWSAQAMAPYWDRLNTWLPTESPVPLAGLLDDQLRQVLFATAAAVSSPLRGALQLLDGLENPNDPLTASRTDPCLCFLPLTTRRNARTGTRERLRDVRARYPDRLHIACDATVTQVLLDKDNRATGVAVQTGPHLYRAAAAPGRPSGPARPIRATREVILAGGAFNTPQLLMLSGIGPAAELRRHRIPLRIDLPGVGANLQDRYEVGVVHRMAREWDGLKAARFNTTDPVYRAWQSRRSGLYITNGSALAIPLASSPARTEADLICLAFLARFTGYYPGYAAEMAAQRNYLTWAILKAHTNNRAGTIRLRSADPLEPPDINFRYFDEGSDIGGEDLRAVVAGLKFVRSLTAGLRRDGVIAEQEMPADGADSDEALAQYARDTAWGHHASCTCPIAPIGAGGVLDSRFQVYGTTGLRVVDASVFPRIPGFFIVSAVYMAAEKAADVILADAR